MENAGRTLASHVIVLGDGPALVVAGSGGNGEGGLACARHLANHDVDVTVVPDRDPRVLTEVAARQHRILDERGVSIDVGSTAITDPEKFTAVVDALIGHGLTGAVRETAESLI